MSSNKIDDLRTHLFETLAALKDKNAPMELDRARAVADVAKVIVDSAKVEVDFLKVTGAVRSTGFIPEADPAAPVARRLNGQKAPAPIASDGDRCVLCGCKLETRFNIERGLCGSCQNRAEALQLPRDANGKALAPTPIA